MKKYKNPPAKRLENRKRMAQWRKDHPERAKEHYRRYWRKKRGYYYLFEKDGGAKNI
jgi:hypothetical protein